MSIINEILQIEEEIANNKNEAVLKGKQKIEEARIKANEEKTNLHKILLNTIEDLNKEYDEKISQLIDNIKSETLSKKIELDNLVAKNQDTAIDVIKRRMMN